MWGKATISQKFVNYPQPITVILFDRRFFVLTVGVNGHVQTWDQL